MKSCVSDCWDVESTMSYRLFLALSYFIIMHWQSWIIPLPALHNPFSRRIFILFPSPFHLFPSPFHPIPPSLSLSPSLSTPPHHPLSLSHYKFPYITSLSQSIPLQMQEAKYRNQFCQSRFCDVSNAVSTGWHLQQPRYWSHYVCKR